MSANSMHANAASLTHASDIDGLASAAFVKMRLGIDAKRIFFCDYTLDSLLYASERIKPLCRPGFTLFITDIGMNAGLEKAFVNLLSYINKKGGKVVWFDHHPWSERDISKTARLCQIAIIGENRRYCATEITRKMLGLDDRFSIKLANIVHYSDFNLKPSNREMRRLIGIYALSISSYSTINRRDAYSKLRNLTVLLSGHKLISNSIKADATAFSKLNRLRISKMLGELYIYDNAASFCENLDLPLFVFIWRISSVLSGKPHACGWPPPPSFFAIIEQSALTLRMWPLLLSVLMYIPMSLSLQG